MRTKPRTIELLHLLLVASLVGPAVLLAAMGWLTYRGAFADAESETSRTSEVGREHASKVFDSFRLVSDRVQDALEGLDDAAIRSSEQALHSGFVKIIRDLPQIQSFIVIGADGHPLVATAAYPVATAQDFSDRDYFNALKKPDARTYFSRVQKSRITGETFFGWGEARRGVDNQFAGVIDIAISPDFFMHFYDTLVREAGEGPDGRVVTMIRDDGQILVRYPPIEGAPVLVPRSNPFFAALGKNPDEGSYTNRSVVDAGAPERLFAYRKVPGQPIYIVAGRSTDAIVGQWLHAMLAYAAVAVLAAVVLFWVTLITLRGARREQAALKQLSAEMVRRETAEEQLRQAQKMEAVGQLTGGIAHDFNNLLTVIRSSIDLLRRPNLAEDRRRRYLDAISDTTTRAANLTGQLLAFARRQALQPETFDVAESLKTVLEMVRPLVGSRIAIELDAPTEPLFVHVDAGQFDTSIVNIAVNARDAMNGEGRLALKVRTVDEIPALGSRPSVSGSYVAVAITDTGHGIAGDKIERIFEPFFTTKEVGQGTGLGLSQVFGFAKQSGGDVVVESQFGQGATFTLYLPRVAGGVPPRTADPRPASRTSMAGVCVLVVEDNLDVGSFVADSLAELGCKSALTTNADEALAALEKGPNRFDAVFSDVVMPGMNGIELGREIRRRYGALPIVLTSGYSHVLAEGGTGEFELLHKPYSVEQLADVLRRVIRARPEITATPS